MNRIFLTVLSACLFISLYGQTVEEVVHALEGKVFTQKLPSEDDWNGPTLIEFMTESGKIIRETPNIASAEFTYDPGVWMIAGEDGAVELVFKGENVGVVQIDSISDGHIYGRFPVDPADNRDPNEGKTENRFNLFVVHNPIFSLDQLLWGTWNVIVDEDAKKSPHFTTLEISENGHYKLYGVSADQNGTWHISPSGRYFIISESDKEDSIFRIEDLTDDRLALLQGHYYTTKLLNFEKKD